MSPQAYLGSAGLTQAPLEQCPLQSQSLVSQSGSLGDLLNSFLHYGAFLVLLLESHLRARKRLLRETQTILRGLP